MRVWSNREDPETIILRYQSAEEACKQDLFLRLLGLIDARNRRHRVVIGHFGVSLEIMNKQVTSRRL